MKRSKINILHLRASEGGGGGPEKTIFKTSLQINREKYWHGVCYLRKFEKDLGAIASRYHQNGLPYFEIPGNKADLRQLWRIQNLCKRHRVHILHTHDSKTIIYGALMKLRVPNLILATTLHGWVPRRRRSRLYQQMAEWSLKAYDAVVAVSDDLEKKIRQKGIRRTLRIHNAIDLNQWPLLVDSQKFMGDRCPYRVGYIGRISREKGPAQFLKVARLLSRLDEDIQFIMIGEGPLAAWVKTEIQRLKLDHLFTLTGYVPQTEIAAMYGGLDLLLSTSHTEGLPNTLLEALACGISVVATRVGGVAEVVTHGHNGLLVPDGDTTALAQSVLDLKANPQRAARFSRNGSARIRAEFNFPKRIASMERLYTELVMGGSR